MHNEHVKSMLAYIEDRPSLNMRSLAREVGINYNQLIDIKQCRKGMPEWHEENLDKVLRLYGYNEEMYEVSCSDTDPVQSNEIAATTTT